VKRDDCHACYDARVTGFEMLGGYRVRLEFEDGLTGDVDLGDLPASGGFYEPLQDLEFFRNEARVDWLTLCWPGEIDLDPCNLYHQAKDHLVRPRRRRWFRRR